MDFSQWPVIALPMARRAGHEARRDLDDFVVGEKYVAALATHSACWARPICPPTNADADNVANPANTAKATNPAKAANTAQPAKVLPAYVAAMMAGVHGLLLTGDLANVHPRRYHQNPTAKHEPFDPCRDAMAFAMIQIANQRGLPIFAICRGMQELNVYYGGSLHARVHETPALMDHRAPIVAGHEEDSAVLYGPNHGINLVAGGTLAAMLDQQSRVTVNSLHWQGLDGLGEGLCVEARADDGLVEAVTIKPAIHPGWSLGVQWHPEADCHSNPHSAKLFTAFGQAAQEFKRKQGSPA